MQTPTKRLTARRMAFLLPLSFLLLPATGAAAMGLKVQWSAGSACSGQAPAMVLSSVPKGTAKIALAMKDLDLPSYDHGGGELEFTGKTSFGPGEAFGLFASYRGPCPPPGTSHRYQWSAEARDAAGKRLGAASTTIPFGR